LQLFSAPTTGLKQAEGAAALEPIAATLFISFLLPLTVLLKKRRLLYFVTPDLIWDPAGDWHAACVCQTESLRIGYRHLRALPNSGF